MKKDKKMKVNGEYVIFVHIVYLSLLELFIFLLSLCSWTIFLNNLWIMGRVAGEWTKEQEDKEGAT